MMKGIDLRSKRNMKERSFGDHLLEMFKKDPSQPEERKRKRLVTNCEIIITTTKYLQKKEQEEKENDEKNRLKDNHF
ncbi:hypothetical protein JTB14_029307 [Gonioctena quinquepunctata]|nr:hypothetical protein JTB14_029307 [Gonioctena quinquepunctata]